MIVQFSCPSCRARYRVEESKLGQTPTVRCKKCQAAFQWRKTLEPVTDRQGQVAANHGQDVSVNQQQTTTPVVLKERYQLTRLSGAGGMGRTYHALDLTSQQPVAAKILRFSQIKEWKTLELFEREARILQQLNHPQIPAYLDYFSLETGPDMQFVLIQEYIEGQSLQQLVEGGWQATEAEILAVFRQVIDILAYLHTLRPPVVHRDVTPKNLIRTDAQQVFLVDFGGIQETIRTTLFGGSTVIGTCGYAPFEQFQGKAVPASDYYALGATLLFLLTHKHPSEFPLHNLKPVFQEEVQASSTMLRLLNGLLEPEIGKRIASPEQAAAILNPSLADEQPGQSAVSHHPVVKPEESEIEKEITPAGSLLFRFPANKAKPSSVLSKDLLSFFKKKETSTAPLILELTPQWINFNNLWNAPTSALLPTDITWHVEKDLPVLGINYQDRTFALPVQLTPAEIEWLLQEFQEYIARLPKGAPPADFMPVRQMPARPAWLAKLLPMPQLTKTYPGEGQVRMSIPREATEAGCLLAIIALPVMFLTMALPPAIFGPKIGGALIPFLWMFVVGPMLIGGLNLINRRTTIIEITPAHLVFKDKLWRWETNKFPPIPLDALRVTDINWYVREISGGRGTTLKTILGINYGGVTHEIDGLKVSRPELGQLVQDMRDQLPPTNQSA